MEQKLKQRLIGASVLVALAVIFIPMVFNGPAEQQTLDVPIEIPPRPQVSEAPGLPAPDDGGEALVAERAPSPRPLSAQPSEQPPEQAPADGGKADGPDDLVVTDDGETVLPVVKLSPEGQSNAEQAAAQPPAEAPAPTPETAQPNQSEPDKQPAPATAEQPELAAYAVQVGSFGRQNNAIALRDRLRKAKFTVFVDATRNAGSEFFRVRIGPVMDRAEAEALRERLKKEQSLDGLVVSHP